MHIFNVFKLSEFGNFLSFVSHCYSVVRSTLSVLMLIVSMVLPVRVVLVVSIWEPFSCFLLYSDHLLYHAYEFFIVSRVLFAEVLKLPLGHDPMGESFDYFSFGDVLYLST
jgi:hypothetical protein